MLDGVLVLLCTASFVLVPFALVWPRFYSRLVPPVLRGRIAASPSAWAAGLAAVPALAVTIVTSKGLVDLDVARPLRDRLFALLLVAVIFGGATAAAVYRCVVIGAREWALAGRRRRRPAHRAPDTLPSIELPTVQLPTSPLPTSAGPSLARPAEHRSDRSLRNAARWLATVGIGWYLFGRVLQLVGMTGGETDVPGWWWAGVFALCAFGAVVWFLRRRRKGSSVDLAGWRAAGSRLRALGFVVEEPATPQVRAFAPGAFWSPAVVVGPTLWPLAARGLVDGCPVLVAVQHGQHRRATGLTTGRTRTVCAVKLAGARLPSAVVTGREGVPPLERPRAVDLELEQFNRSLWAWGPDAGGLYAVMHPRAMAAALEALPDGASAVFHLDHIAVYNDEPVSAEELVGYVRFVARLAALTPSYLSGSRVLP